MKKVLVMLAIVMVGVFSSMTVSQVSAVEPRDENQRTSSTCSSSFLGFPAWYNGVTNSDCTIKVPKSSEGKEMSDFIWRIALNVLQIAIMAVAYLSAFYIIYGGFQYLLSRGSPDGMKKGKNAILSAVIGLVISLVAIGVVNIIVNGLGL